MSGKANRNKKQIQLGYFAILQMNITIRVDPQQKMDCLLGISCCLRCRSLCCTKTAFDKMFLFGFLVDAFIQRTGKIQRQNFVCHRFLEKCDLFLCTVTVICLFVCLLLYLLLYLLLQTKDSNLKIKMLLVQCT